MVDHCNKDHIWDRNNVESTLHNAFDKELSLEFSLRWSFKSDSISLWTNEIASLKNHFETSLIHDAVSTMLVCRKQPNQIYIHVHGKKAVTLQVKIFYSMSSLLFFKIEEFFNLKCWWGHGDVVLPMILIFNLDLVLFCDLVIKLKFTSTNNLFHVFSLFEI